MAKPFCFAFCLVSAWSTWVAACDTPVYRYAMYRWQPTPFELYYFHEGTQKVAMDAANIETVIADARDRIENPANVEFYDVDLKADPELKTIPPDVRRYWEGQNDDDKENSTPAFLLVNPAGNVAYHGDFTVDDARQLVDSPLRTTIGKELAKGHAGVYLLVPGKDEELNAGAKAALEKLVAQVNGGELDLYVSPEAIDPLSLTADEQATDEDSGEEENADESTKAAVPHTVAMLTLSAASAQKEEAWLYRSLMAVEADLHEFKDEPMVFALYGRGRALPPYIGKGVTFDNLVDVTYFITGACSCTVKDQNPGVDILMAYDWESASASVADRFGSEEGNEEQLGDLFPQLLIPASVETEDETTDEQPDSTAAVDEAVTSDDEPETATPEGQPDEANPVDGTTTDDPSTEPEIDVAVVEQESDDDEPGKQEEPDEDDATVALADLPGREVTEVDEPVLAGPGFLMFLAFGLGVAFVGLLCGTFLILKAH